jgi:hypothetical protein
MGCAESKPTEIKPTSEVKVEDEYKPIHSAVRWNKMADVKSLIRNTADANIKDTNNGNSPIHIAAQNGHTEVCQFLIDKKCDLNAKNMKGNTAIHMSVGYDYYEASMSLINGGADQEIPNELGFIAIMGLEGDKSLGMAAFLCASTIAEFIHAFTLIESNNGLGCDKAAFASHGMKSKKILGVQWTPEIQDRFKKILMSLK